MVQNLQRGNLRSKWTMFGIVVLSPYALEGLALSIISPLGEFRYLERQAYLST